MARCHRRVRDYAPLPNGIYKIVLADHTLAVEGQVLEEIKHLRCDGDRISTPTQFPLVGVKHAIFEEIAQPRYPIFLGNRNGAQLTTRQ